MRDKNLAIMLAVMFGICGLIISVLAIIEPMSGAEKILTMLMGIGGIIFAYNRARLYRELSQPECETFDTELENQS